TLRTSIRALVSTGLTLGAAAILLSYLKIWPTLLGLDFPGANVAVGLALAVWGLTLWCSLGYRVLIGSGRANLAVYLQAGACVLTLVLTFSARLLTSPLWVFCVIPFASASVTAIIALRRGLIPLGISTLKVLTSAFDKQAPGERIRHVAGPVAAITATTPITF